jgi:hypothetical protein
VRPTPTPVSRTPKLLGSSGANQASLVLEVVKARYGPVTHGVYIVFCCFCNILGLLAFNQGRGCVRRDLHVHQ